MKHCNAITFKHYLLGCLLAIFASASYAQQLSPEAEVSVLTIGPGTSLNDAFGHNVFRIKDPQTHMDVAYDYGRFPFNDPGFYLNFARGKLNYSIGKSAYPDVKDFYIWQNRTITEQVLNISASEKQALFNFLINNYKPENRNYLYDFFFDNCATKIKDVVNTVFDDPITFNQPQTYQEQSFRTLIQNELDSNSWGSLGIDIALGSVIDRKATPEEQMFLPKNIEAFFGVATIKDKPLVQQTNILYKKQAVNDSKNLLVSPFFILGVVALIIIIITYLDYKNHKRSAYLDTMIFLITGIIGVFILLLWFATDHSATAQNYNLLWACPLNLLLVYQLHKKAPKPWIRKFVKFIIIMLCLMGFHWIVGIQVFAPALLPIGIALATRYLFLVHYLKTT